MRDLGSIVALLVALVGATLVPSTRSRAERTAIPDAIRDAVQSLKAPFSRTYAAGPAEVAVAQAARESSDTIEKILRYASSSDQAPSALADHLCELLQEFARQFGPGQRIDEGLLPADGGFAYGTAPFDGLDAWSYLLIEVVRQQRSPRLSKQALAAIHAVVPAVSHYFRELARAQGVVPIDEAARQNTPCRTIPGARLAWCCERFMTDMYLADEPFLPEPAMEVVTEYWKWRKAYKLDNHWPGDLPDDEQFKTMEYVGKLVDALPTE